MRVAAYILAVLLSVLAPAKTLAVELNWFVQGNYSFNLDESNPDKGDFKWAEERGQLRIEHNGLVHLFLKADASFDHLDDDSEVEVREAYVDMAKELWDVRLGRQVITWGLGDLVFINDVFPKDFEAFFSGRPLEYMKKGVDGVKVGFYPGIASFELVAIPFFEPNSLPSSERFHLYNPMAGLPATEAEPASTLSNAEVALRAYRDVSGTDAAIYLYKGFNRTYAPVPDSLSAPTTLTLSHPELNVFGASLQRGALSGVLSFEAGYYDSKEDPDGIDPLVPNSQARFLASYQRELAEDFSATFQYYGELMQDYSEYRANALPGFALESEYRELLSVRLTYLALHQNLRLSWFSFWGKTDEDYMLNPEARYNFTDRLWGAVGVNIFGGESPTTQFGSLDKNDNAYLQVRYEI